MSDQNSESPGSQNSGYSVNSMKQGTPGNSDGSASDEMFKQETSNSVDHPFMHSEYQEIHANIDQEQLLNSDDESTMIEDHNLYGHDQCERNKDTDFVQQEPIDLQQVLKDTSDRIQDLITARSILYGTFRQFIHDKKKQLEQLLAEKEAKVTGLDKKLEKLEMMLTGLIEE